MKTETTRDGLIAQLSDLLKRLDKQKTKTYPIWDPTKTELTVKAETADLSEAVRQACVYAYHQDVGMSEHTEPLSYDYDGYLQPMTSDQGLWRLLEPVLNKKVQPEPRILRDQLKELSSKTVEPTKSRKVSNILTAQQQLWLPEWEKDYQELFNLKTDLSVISVPKAQGDMEFPIYVLPEISYDQIWTACKQMHSQKFYIWDDSKPLSELLDLSQEERDTNIIGPYCILARYEQEANAENKNKSANDIVVAKMLTMTLRERLLFELFYFRKENKHPDKNNWTLCSGSRCLGGHVPSVHWDSDDRLLVVRWTVDYSYGRLRSRSVVSS